MIVHLAEDADPTALACDGMFGFGIWDGNHGRRTLGDECLGTEDHEFVVLRGEEPVHWPNRTGRHRPTPVERFLEDSSSPWWAEHRSRESYLSLVDATWENRAFGDFWHHCLVAEGAIDLAAEPIVSPWDLAAVQVLVEQAGGRFTDLDGAARFDGGTALSSNGLLHDAALAVLQR